jgi:colicin import membrane protein
MPSPLDHSTLKPPSTTLKGRYILLAVAVHVLLIIALSMNFYWRSETPPPAQAELWTALPEPVQTQPVQRTPDPAPTPQQPVQPPPRVTPPQPSDAEIALEQARRQAAERERQAAEQQRQEQARREQAQREEQQRQEQARQEQRRQEEQARQEQARRDQARREAAERERLRQEQLARIQSMAGGSGNSTSGASGPTGGTGRASDAYGNRLAGIVKRNIVYAGDNNDNSMTIVYVETDNNGNIKTVRITQSSGNQAWDDAVERALWKTAQLPADIDGKRPTTTFNFRFRPND